MREYSTLGELTEASASFYDNLASKRATEALDTRRKLSGWIRKFHSECGTLTPKVEQALENLDADNCVLLMTAHQPNLFAYGGVLRKATLLQVLAKSLTKRLAAPVVSFFGFADQDFADDKWVKYAELPDIERRNGTLELRIRLPEKIMLNKIPRPPAIILTNWKQEIRDWIHREVKSISELACMRLDEHDYLEKLEQLWTIVTNSYDKARNYADFNAFTLSQSINSVWEYDTLFCRFSECQQILVRQFSCLIDRFQEYSVSVREAEERSEGKLGGVSSDEYLTIPVWYHCQCGSKARLMVIGTNQPVLARGNCLNCDTHFEIDFSSTSKIWTEPTKLSARALAVPMVLLPGLCISCYVGGAGGRQYLLQATDAATHMGIDLPPIGIWRPRDYYLGLGQVEALLTLRKIIGSINPCQLEVTKASLQEKLAAAQHLIDELETRKKHITATSTNEKISEMKTLAKQQDTIRRENDTAMLSRHLGLLTNAERISNMYPCAVDYAVNIGLKNVSEQWERSLQSTRDLTSDITLRTAMDSVSQLNLEPSWPSLMRSLGDGRIDG